MRVHVIRPDDLLVCELEFVGIDLKGTPPNRRLVRQGGDACVIVHLPPQHVAEKSYREDARPSGHVLVPSRIAGPSRVAFRVPKKRFPIDFKLEAILDLLNSCRLAIPANAVKGPETEGFLWFLRGLWFFAFPPAVAPPGPGETAIELPLRLILSPDEHAGFAHAVKPVTDVSGERVELWHTRLQTRPNAGGGPENEPGRGVRAVWMRAGDGVTWDPNRPRWQDHFISPGEPPIGDDEPFGRDDTSPFAGNAMSQRDRHDIVHVSGNWRYARQTGADYIPRPVAVRRLALSALGAWLDSVGVWDPSPEHTSLLQWTHGATQGRDHLVELVYAGYLYPFMHRASKIKVTKRNFVDKVRGEPPLLLQREYIVVRQRRCSYEQGAPAERQHTMPLLTMEFHTMRTADLAPRRAGESPDLHVIRASQPGSVGSEPPFLFSVTCTDAEQATVDLSTPLVWVNSTFAWDPVALEKADQLYAAEASHRLDARGLPLALTPGPKGDTTFPTHTLTFTAPPLDPMPEAPDPPVDEDRPRTNRQPGFWPQLKQATIHVPALDMIAGVGSIIPVSYHRSYFAHGLDADANPGQVFAKLDTPLALDFREQGERAGALLQPNMLITGLSRQLGPVGGPADPAEANDSLDDVARGRFFPEAFFGGADAKLFGVFDLDMVLRRVDNADPSEMPRIATEVGAESLVTNLVWNPTPQGYPPADPTFGVTDATTIEVVATVDTRSDTARPGMPRSDVKARIENFDLNLFGGLGRGLPTFLRLHFDKLEFVALAGKKPDVSVVLSGIEFAGDLAFVDELRSIIPLDGFADPPAIDVTPDGIRSNFSLSVPSVAVGVFALQNVSLGAGFAIPFTAGALTVSFNFCTREEPFLLTVSMFGGGGYLELTVDPAGVQRLEAALEFGASVAIDLGVAQGGVEVMAGIYFADETGKGATLSGYFRLCGNMSVLGLISASIELELRFTYQNGKATGRAEIEVEIDIFLFSFSVTVECERRIAGSGRDPTFDELMAPYPDPEQVGQTVRPWNLYCRAYV